MAARKADRDRPAWVETWPAFEELGRRHDGVWGGCWCTWFHRESHSASGGTAEGSRAVKQRLVESGDARRIMAHMLRETSRHAGHADMLRERIDGRTND